MLWDVDGVIIDSAEQHRQSWQRLAEENGFAYSDERFWETFGMRNADVIPALFGTTLPVERVVGLAERKEEIYRELARGTSYAVAGSTGIAGGSPHRGLPPGSRFFGTEKKH